MPDNRKFGIILNPAAGRGHALRVEKQLIDCLKQRNINFQLEKTKEPLHATEIARRMCGVVDCIIAVGGDGTVNEVAAGMLGSTTALAVIPIGSGNDFNKIIGIPHDPEKAIEIILSGGKKSVDAGAVTIKNSSGVTVVKHFLNVLGIGIDAEIAKETKRINFLRGLPLYLLAAIKALSTYKPNEYTISSNNKTITEKTYLLCAGNGMYEGGGFKMLPGADPCDGKLNICLIRKMSPWNAISVIPKIIRGTHGDHPLISTWETASVKLVGKKPFIIHGDGEIFEENAIEATIEVMPNELTVVIP
jgi:diacylglycerol kinase (ATP)